MSATKGYEKDYLPGMGHDRLLPIYDPLHRLLGLDKLHRTLVDQADVRPGHRVLEIGCGTGNLALLVKRLYPDAEVVGIDPDPKALARAGRKAGRKGPLVRLDRGFAEDLPYPDASFDRVLSAFMFHHLGSDEKKEALREVRRVLTPGGSLQLLDLGQAKASHRSHRNHGLHGGSGKLIVALMREAGFADPVEVEHRVKKGLGRVAYYSATVPASLA